MNYPEDMHIEKQRYVREDLVKSETVEFTGEETVASRMIGKNVIVRSRNEGINVGTVVIADNTGVELKNCRRLWYHKPADVNLSWYEGVAMSGVSSDSKVSGTIERKVIIEDYSLTEFSSVEAYNSVMEKEPNGQN